MTVSSTQNRAAFNCDGVTTQFDFNFPYQRDADIRVLVRSPTGVETTLANLSDYSIANAGTGGRITVANPRSSGWRIVILRAPEPVQETDLLENGTYSAETLERAYDYRAMVEQRLADLLARALILAETDTQGTGTYLAGGNRITALGDAVAGTDAVTLAQVQGLVAAGGGGGGGTTVGWPPLPIPPAVQDAINQGVLTASEFQAVFTPINSQIGNLSAQILSLNSSVAGINTSIGTINTSITSMQADIDLLEQISGDANNIITLIQTEEQERIDGDVAMAAVIAKIGAADADTVSFILNTATVKISPTETIGTRFSGIATQLGTATASIASEQTARIAGDNTLAQTIAKIGALSGNGAAFIIDVNTAYVDATTSLGQRFSGLTSAVNGANAAITSEASTRASADTSLASQISTLQSSVSGFNVSIQANATAINGVQAKYTVKIDNNGRVTGFGLISEPNNGSIVSSFVINADAFKVFNGSTDVAPFLVTGGVVRMQDVQIVDAVIQSLSVSKLTLGTLGADINVGAGRIVFDDGVMLRAQGTGFGTSAQFIDWYGPRPTGGNIALCSEATATFYLKKGVADAYFGGALSAGVIKIAGRTTDQASNAEVVIGPFTTNGGAKTIVLSYAWHRDHRCDAGTGGIATQGSATVVLEKSTNGSSWTQIGSMNLTGSGSVNVDGDPEVKDLIIYNTAGSTTVTDNEGATNSMYLRARITARTLPTFNGTGTSNTNITQTTGFVSTEE